MYAHREDSSWHDAAYRHLTTLAEGLSPWAIPWPCIHEFLAIVTHPRIYVPPTPLERALDQINALIESPSLMILSENQEYWPEFRTILSRSKVIGPQIHDARITALCKASGVSELWSADRDFSRFPELKVINPLVR